MQGREKANAKTARKHKKADLCPKGPGSSQTTGEKGFGKGKKGKKGEEPQETQEVKEQAQPKQPEAKPAPSMPRVSLNSQQKAAAVIVALGADKASHLYKFMEPDDVEQLTIEVAKLGLLGSEQTEEVLTEFYQMCLSNKAVTEGGLEYARAVLEKAYGPQTAEDRKSVV